jgi:hypothetical protein
MTPVCASARKKNRAPHGKLFFGYNAPGKACRALFSHAMNNDEEATPVLDASSAAAMRRKKGICFGFILVCIGVVFCLAVYFLPNAFAGGMTRCETIEHTATVVCGPLFSDGTTTDPRRLSLCAAAAQALASGCQEIDYARTYSEIMGNLSLLLS